MPRTAPLSEPELMVTRRMEVLRETFKLPQTVFASLAGLKGARLGNRLNKLSPWRPKEVEVAEVRVRTHLAACLAAFETCFGEPAFPFAPEATARRRTLKLERALTGGQRAQLQAAKARLAGLVTDLEAAEVHLAKLHEEKADVEARIGAARRAGGHSREHAAELNTLTTQLGLIDPPLLEAAARLEGHRQAGTGAVAYASELIRSVCEPLFGQLKAEVEAALTPFYADPTGRAGQIVADTDMRNALVTFLQRGLYLSREASAERVTELAGQLLATLEALLEGRPVFTFKPVTWAMANGR